MKKSKPKAVFNWSGGKDSALALHKVLNQEDYEVVSLLTTVNKDNKLSTMHNIPVLLLQKQAESIGIPLYIVELNSGGNMKEYEKAMQSAVDHFKKKEVTHFIFGDIFLHDVKTYREEKLAPFGIKVVEPLWGKTSEEIIQDFFDSGLKTIIVTTMADLLDKEFIGRRVDEQLLNDLPEEVDVCGENGEYHTFCFAGSIFKNPVSFDLGVPFKKSFPIKMEDGIEKIYSYWFADLKV